MNALWKLIKLFNKPRLDVEFVVIILYPLFLRASAFNSLWDVGIFRMRSNDVT